MRPSRFTIEEINEIRHSFERGDSIFEIAKKWKVNPTTIYYWCGRKKASPYTPCKREKIYHKKFKSYRDYVRDAGLVYRPPVRNFSNWL